MFVYWIWFIIPIWSIRISKRIYTVTNNDRIFWFPHFYELLSRQPKNQKNSHQKYPTQQCHLNRVLIKQIVNIYLDKFLVSFRLSLYSQLITGDWILIWNSVNSLFQKYEILIKTQWSLHRWIRNRKVINFI